MIHLYTGNGKGKTTAATGLAVRAAGCGKRVMFTQFMKGNESGELEILKMLENVTICRSVKNFGFYSTLSDAEKKELTSEHNRILDEILEMLKQERCDLVVMDEITYPVNWNLLDQEKLQQVLSYGKQAELVLTGRSPKAFIMDAADYLTEMNAVRHPFEQGVPARKGVEY